MNSLTYSLTQFPDSDTGTIIMHGSTNGMGSSLIQATIAKSIAAGYTTLAFNFPYLDRGDESYSSDELIEEVEALVQAVAELKSTGVKKVILIGKSLGGVVATYYLASSFIDKDIQFDLGILGLVIKSVKVPQNVGKVVIVQGEKDRFGTPQEVETFMNEFPGEKTVIGIPGADHSYRDENRDPVFENEAVEALFKHL